MSLENSNKLENSISRIIKKVYLMIKEIRIIRKFLEFLNYEIKENSPKIVSADLVGGLGNQMFQIANVLAYSWKYSLKPLFKKYKKIKDRTSFRPTYWNSVFQNIPTIKHLPLNLAIFKEKSILYHKIPSPNNILNTSEQNGIYFYGYFGSPKYFDEFREQIISYLFYINKNQKNYLKKKYPKIFSNHITIAIHIRREDYTHQSLDGFFTKLWETDYYDKAIKFIQDKIKSKNVNFYIFSDDLEWCRVYVKLKLSQLKFSFPHEKDYLDMYLMSLCKHIIIANSTFSWWAGYLNNYSQKLVISPKNWFGPNGPSKWDDIYLKDWIKL